MRAASYRAHVTGVKESVESVVTTELHGGTLMESHVSDSHKHAQEQPIGRVPDGDHLSREEVNHQPQNE